MNTYTVPTDKQARRDAAWEKIINVLEQDEPKPHELIEARDLAVALQIQEKGDDLPNINPVVNEKRRFDERVPRDIGKDFNEADARMILAKNAEKHWHQQQQQNSGGISATADTDNPHTDPDHPNYYDEVQNPTRDQLRPFHGKTVSLVRKPRPKPSSTGTIYTEAKIYLGPGNYINLVGFDEYEDKILIDAIECIRHAKEGEFLADLSDD